MPTQMRKTKVHREPTRDSARNEKSSKRSAQGTRAATPHSKRTTQGAEFQPGDILDGTWEIERKLGAGGMGTVYAARHVRNDARAAIKILHPSYAKVPYHREMFLREGLVDNQVDAAVRQPLPEGPGAVRVLGDGETASGAPYLVMEALQGGSLIDNLHQYGTPPAEAVTEVLDEVLATLEGAHGLGIVHRDVKPENIFVTEPALDVRVLDWGLAKLPDDVDGLEGHSVGTLGYAAPEQVLGRTATPASDVWGAGATGYVMLTNRLPVDPEFQGRLMSQIGPVLAMNVRPDNSNFPGCPVPSVLTYAPNTPPHLAAVIDRALACDPAARYPDAGAMREDLLRPDLQQAVEAEMAKT